MLHLESTAASILATGSKSGQKCGDVDPAPSVLSPTRKYQVSQAVTGADGTRYKGSTSPRTTKFFPSFCAAASWAQQAHWLTLSILLRISA